MCQPDDRAGEGCGVKKRATTPWFAVDGARSLGSNDDLATQSDAERKVTVRLLPGTATNDVGTADRHGGEARRYAARRPLKSNAVVGWRVRAVMAPPNSSRAGKCRTFLGAAARRRRLRKDLGKSSPAAECEIARTPAAKTPGAPSTIAPPPTWHHPAVREGTSLTGQRPAPPGAVSAVSNGSSRAASFEGRGDAGVFAAGVMENACRCRPCCCRVTTA